MEKRYKFGKCISSLYVVVFIRSIYFAFKSTNMSTFTLTWSAELLHVGWFIPVKLFEVHQMDKEQSSTYDAFWPGLFKAGLR